MVSLQHFTAQFVFKAVHRLCYSGLCAVQFQRSFAKAPRAERCQQDTDFIIVISFSEINKVSLYPDHTFCLCKMQYLRYTLCGQLRCMTMITIEDFDKVQICAGTVTSVSINKKARKPAYKVTLDFGPELGEKTSSAQLTELYRPEDLLGKQLICCVNLEPMHIGSVKSEVRILGTDSKQGVVLLTPMEPVENGDPVF